MLASSLLFLSTLLSLVSAFPAAHVDIRAPSRHHALSNLEKKVSSDLAVADPHALQKRGFGGRATWFVVGLGACGQYSQPSDFMVALNSAQYVGGSPGPNCFRKITITAKGKSAQAVIMDECPTCAYGSLDLSHGLFTYFASESEGEFEINWSFNDDNSEPEPKPTTHKEEPKPTTTKAKPTPTPTPTPEPTPEPEPTPTPPPKPKTTSKPPAPTTTSTPPPPPPPSTTTKSGSSSSSTPVKPTTTSIKPTTTSTPPPAPSASSSPATPTTTTNSSSAAAPESSAPAPQGSESNLETLQQLVLGFGNIIVSAANSS